jgi:Na+-transporting methylmalonyl-CoA/oxaloacetate decarboxylase gamma subunit
MVVIGVGVGVILLLLLFLVFQGKGREMKKESSVPPSLPKKKVKWGTSTC